MSHAYNDHIQEVLRLTREMMVLADLGDQDRIDSSCGVLYGNLRDAAWKLRRDAEQERLLHMQNGQWDKTDNDHTAQETTSAGD